MTAAMGASVIEPSKSPRRTRLDQTADIVGSWRLNGICGHP